MNPSTAFAPAFADELIRCGLAEVVIAPGSRSAPLAMALWHRAAGGPGLPGVPGGRTPGPALRLHVRIDERSAAFLALGLAKASRRPVAVVCTSGTAAAHLHAAVIEADEAGVPLLVLTADRPPELRGTGANQTIDQLKLYGGAVRWFCEAGVPEARPGMNAYWRSLACRAWAAASGALGTQPGPVHLNLSLREPLVPDAADAGTAVAGWPEALTGRPGGGPWTVTGGQLGASDTGDAAGVTAPGPRPGGPLAAMSWWAPARQSNVTVGAAMTIPALELPWTERGVVICGDGCGDPAALARLAQEAGWPLLAEVAPILLVLGQPLLLALHASRNPVHRWLQRVLRSRPVTLVTWPPVAFVVYSAVVGLTHLTSFMNLAVENRREQLLELFSSDPW